MKIGKRYTYMHGWVEACQANSSSDECLLTLRQDNAQTIMLTVSKPDWFVQIGNEISVAIKNNQPSHAVALIDHTACSGAFLPCPDRPFPDQEDAIITAALLILTLAVSGWRGLPMYALLVVSYGLARFWLPEAIHRQNANRISYLIDRDYQCWLEVRDK